MEVFFGSDGSQATTILNLDHGETIGINSGNAQIMQSFEGQCHMQFPRNVNFKAGGSGCDFVQVTLRHNARGEFNVKITEEMGPSKPSSPIEVDSCNKRSNSLQTSARLRKREEDMAIVEAVGIPTGFDGNYSETIQTKCYSCDGTKKISNLRRIESGEGKVVFYFGGLEGDTCVAVELTRTIPANNVHPPTARITSYYSPKRSIPIEYTIDELTDVDLV